MVVFLIFALSPLLSFSQDNRLGFEYFNDTLFKSDCTICHSGNTGSGGLRLEKYDDYMELIVPGSPETSELIDRLTSKNPNRRMPPYGNWEISKEELDKLKEWIRQGAQEIGANPSRLGPASYDNIYVKILSPKCLECHTNESLSYLNIKSGVEKAKGGTSFFYSLLITSDRSLRMPLARPGLNSVELELIKKWIHTGMPEK